jgi:thiol-disulfide isomerase/thioredoxin
MLASSNLPRMKKLGMKELTERPGTFAKEHEESFKASAYEIIKRFPKNGRGYSALLAIAERAKGEEQKQLAQELLDMEGASPAVKAMARHVLAGTKPFEIGKPLDIRFTALDGREVDLAKLKGKVVLVDFWATDCGPCVAEMPEIKAVYEKFHEKGFEIVGISLDDKETVLRRFLRDKALTWPQHFDGKGWENRFALHYGVFSIPTMWLVDRSGKLRLTNARENLAGMVEVLLAEKP